MGREADFGKLQGLLQTNGCVVVTGIGGQGKSTLAAMLYRDWQTRHGADKCVWVTCGDQSSSRSISVSEIVLTFAYKQLPTSAQTAPDLSLLQSLEQSQPNAQLNWLLAQLQQANYLLILDNFESLLEQNSGQLLPDKTLLLDLLEAACRKPAHSRLLLTSREYPRSTRQPAALFELPELDVTAGATLLQTTLQKLDVTPLPAQAEMEKAAGPEYARGNPLFLLLLAALVKPQDGQPLSYHLKQPGLWQGDIAHNLLDQIWQARLNAEERLTLGNTAILRSPFRVADLLGLGQQLDHTTEAELLATLASLRRKSLLEVAKQATLPTNPQEASYSLHSQVRRYVLDKLGEAERQHRHLAAAQYFMQQPVPEIKERTGYAFPAVGPRIEAFFQLVGANAFDEAADLSLKERFLYDLHRWGQFRLLVEMYLALLPAPGDTRLQLVSQPQAHGAILGNLGNAYDSLGDYRKAIEFQQKSLAIAQELGDRLGEGTVYGNLGNAYYSLGDYPKAIEFYQKSLAIAQELGDRLGEGNAYGNLGNAHIALKEYRLALQNYILARSVFNGLKLPHMVELVEGNIAKLKAKVGRKKFERLLKELGQV